jgi:ATP-dependent Lhr-like helicase
VLIPSVVFARFVAFRPTVLQVLRGFSDCLDAVSPFLHLALPPLPIGFAMRAMKDTPRVSPPEAADVLADFHAPVREWFEAVFPAPTLPQQLGWPAIARGESTLIFAPTGTGKTLAAFLSCIDRLMFTPPPAADRRCRVLYISPIKALAVDVERNLRAPLAGVAQVARRHNLDFYEPRIAIRTGDCTTAERAQFARKPADILITTPESVYLLLTSSARQVLRSLETVILDEIHALVPNKRGCHLALSLERLEHLCGRKLQRIGLSATQRPLDEVAHFLGGASGSESRADAGENEPPLFEAEPRAAVSNWRPVTIVNASVPRKLDLCIEVPLDDMRKLDEIESIPSGPASKGPTRPSIWSDSPKASRTREVAYFHADFREQPASCGAHRQRGE